MAGLQKRRLQRAQAGPRPTALTLLPRLKHVFPQALTSHARACIPIDLLHHSAARAVIRQSSPSAKTSRALAPSALWLQPACLGSPSSHVSTPPAPARPPLLHSPRSRCLLCGQTGGPYITTCARRRPKPLVSCRAVLACVSIAFLFATPTPNAL